MAERQVVIMRLKSRGKGAQIEAGFHQTDRGKQCRWSSRVSLSSSVCGRRCAGGGELTYLVPFKLADAVSWSLARALWP